MGTRWTVRIARREGSVFVRNLPVIRLTLPDVEVIEEVEDVDRD